MIQNTRFVVFDFDGVLVDTVRAWFNVVTDALRELGAEVNIDTILKKYRGDNLIESIPSFEIEFGVQISSSWVDMVLERAESDVFQRFSPIPGAVDTVKMVDQLGLPIAVASGSFRSNINSGLKALSLDNIIGDRVLSSHDDNRHKPDPNIYIRASRLLGFKACQGIAIEDSTAGVQSASKAGLSVIGYVADTDSQLLINAGAKLTINHMADLPKLLELT